MHQNRDLVKTSKLETHLREKIKDDLQNMGKISKRSSFEINTTPLLVRVQNFKVKPFVIA